MKHVIGAVALMGLSGMVSAGGFAAPIVTQVTNLAPIPVVSVTINSTFTPPPEQSTSKESVDAQSLSDKRD